MRVRRVVGAVAGAAVLTAVTLLSTGPLKAPAKAAVNPDNFVRHVTNPFFPLKPGTLLVYRGIKDGQLQTDRVFVTFRTKTILGVRTTVVQDIARHRSRVLEKTFDWYAQDKQGNVWYFGENTKAFENGHVDTSGSWKAGVNGTRPGIIMESDPRPPDAYRQEFQRGEAEDMAWVINRGGQITVPYGRVGPKLVTLEFTRLEPDVVDRKVYARGFGIVREISMTGARETTELTRVKRP